MTSPRQAAATLAGFLAVALLLASVGAGASGSLTARAVGTSESLQATGEGSIVFVRDEASGARLVLTVAGASVTATAYDRATQQTGNVPDPLGVAPEPIYAYSKESDVVSETFEAVQATAVVVAQLAEFEIHAYAPAGAALVAGSGSSDTVQADEIFVQPGRMGSQRPGIPITPASVPDEFRSLTLPGPLLLHNATSYANMQVASDYLVIEFTGLLVELTDASGTSVIDGRATTESDLAGTGPAESQQISHHKRFVRMVVEKGTLEVATAGGHPVVLAGATELVAAPQGPLHLLGATGTMQVKGQSITADDEAIVLPAGTKLRLMPTDDGVGISPVTSPRTSGNVLVDVGAPAQAVLVLVLATLVVAAGLIVARRLRRPALTSVEKALETGAYAKAARLAKSILRRDPKQEDALLGRAIALTRSGHSDRAVAELQKHLAASEPSDGALHYVLGLAYLDMGRAQEARTTLDEAVRRTPSLEADVSARLGAAVDSQAEPAMAPGATSREVHGYA